MIVNCVAGLFRKTSILRGVFALALGLSLLFALAPQTAEARTHAARAAPAARLYAVSSRHARPRAWLAHQGRFQGGRSHRLIAMAGRGFVKRVASAPPIRLEGGRVPAGGVIAEALRFVGAGNVTGMRGAWCADYASMILRRTGHHALANRTVAAAFAYGPRVRQPRPGDLVVINTRAGYAQHVGFFAGWDHGRMVMVSGNWGHRVAVSPISPGAVAAFIGV